MTHMVDVVGQDADRMMISGAGHVMKLCLTDINVNSNTMTIKTGLHDTPWATAGELAGNDRDIATFDCLLKEKPCAKFETSSS
jgi:hypothetical protein